MNLKKWLAAAALVNVAVLSTQVQAQGTADFAALDGVSAEALTAQDMDAIAGELNAYDIAASLTKLANSISNPVVKADLLKLAAYNVTNAKAINATFSKFGILTACKTCK